LPVPFESWKNGSLNKMLPALLPLARMLGCNSPNPTLDDLQGMYELAANTKVFTESTEKFLKAVGQKKETEVRRTLRDIDRRTGLTKPVPFRSALYGRLDPREFKGVAIWPAGTVSFMHLRREQLRQSQTAGAKFERIIVLGSSRVCGSPADRRHPYVREIFAEGREPTELELLKQWVYGEAGLDPQYVFPELPAKTAEGKDLSLEDQLNYLLDSGQYKELVGKSPVYVPANPNALYVPLHVQRVLCLDDICFSQDGAELVTPVPSHWWNRDQDLMTTPSGTIRFWKEARTVGYINDQATPNRTNRNRRTTS
jgi:hypothetical protein